MSLIKSISGIRGTIGGIPDEALTPLDIVKFTSAYANFIKKDSSKGTIVIGRDARISGDVIASLVESVLRSSGFDVMDLGLSTTPTVEMAVKEESALGGIILTASHNPGGWNALKLLNNKGEFISAADGKELLDLVDQNAFDYVPENEIGKSLEPKDYLQFHIDQIKALPYINVEAIKNAGFSVTFDGINSSGGIAIPRLLQSLGITQIKGINDIPTGIFAHNPEPLPQNLKEILEITANSNADIGIIVDPDVDRLALVDENGVYIGEEYTLVTAADAILSKQPSPTVSNLSSSRALQDVTESHNCEYHSSAVGEVNVVAKMKEVGAKIGGEGNGGVIIPDLHYGRDALAGIALVLSFMAESGKKLSELRASYPSYQMVKDKIQLQKGMNIPEILQKFSKHFDTEKQITIDGVKVIFEDKSWIHLRPSNTEPVIRIYTENTDMEACLKRVEEVRTLFASWGLI